MRERLQNVSQVRDYIEKLKGQLIPMEINKGRNRIVKLQAVIDQVYPSMFVIKTSEKVDLDRMSYSYNDVLCGDVTLPRTM